MSQLLCRPLGERARIGPIHGRPARGIVIATGSWVSRALFFVACSLSSMACLITREPVYEEAPNVPPSVHGSAASPMNRVQIVSLDPESPGADAGPMDTDLPFTAIVRDVNVRQHLRGRVFANLREDAIDALVAEIEIPVAAGSSERTVPFTIPLTELDPGCNWIELHVSEAFEGLPSLAPALDNDIGTGTWFVGATNAASPNAGLDTCESPPSTSE